MANRTNEENWAARERLRVLELLLWWRGWVGRGDLLERFGISAAQASSDFQKYLEINGAGVFYQTSRKRYEAAEGFSCRLHEPTLQEAATFLLGGIEAKSAPLVADGRSGQVAVLTLPQRQVDGEIARRIVMAVLAGQRVQVFYHSLSGEPAAWRALRPAALAWDGRRWHVRAWCEKREQWRDFVLGRMSRAKWPEPATGDLPVDEDWQTWDDLRLRINPAQTAEAQAALRMDYGLESDEITVRVRRALKGYFLAEMLIDGAGHGALPNHFVLES